MKDLVRKAKEGDTDAFSALVKLISPKLYRIALSKLENSNDVDDAIQETMISAFRNLHQLHRLSSFNHWITTNLKNKCIEINKRKHFNTIPFEDFFVKDYMSQYPQEQVEGDLTFKNLIEDLDYEEKIIYYMKIKNLYTFKQIAEELNMTESKVKSTFYRAKDKIKSKI